MLEKTQGEHNLSLVQINVRKNALLPAIGPSHFCLYQVIPVLGTHLTGWREAWELEQEELVNKRTKLAQIYVPWWHNSSRHSPDLVPVKWIRLIPNGHKLAWRRIKCWTDAATLAWHQISSPCFSSAARRSAWTSTPEIPSPQGLVSGREGTPTTRTMRREAIPLDSSLPAGEVQQWIIPKISTICYCY